ncbi:MAG: LysR family transcriptional regulator, hydrogen peroxide-inducible s activator, partial [Bradyrhizobium sp.]|nr:LysR family transcriptional regulator, hydrogen peroxide-inducible s activator [Bradyrhizobium sp.]
AWRPTTSRRSEFRMLGNLIRECLTGTKTAFAPDHDIEALAARPVGIYCGDACVLARRHRLLRLMPSKFPVSDWEPGDHMSPGREMINGSGR